MFTKGKQKASLLRRASVWLVIGDKLTVLPCSNNNKKALLTEGWIAPASSSHWDPAQQGTETRSVTQKRVLQLFIDYLVYVFLSLLVQYTKSVWTSVLPRNAHLTYLYVSVDFLMKKSTLHRGSLRTSHPAMPFYLYLLIFVDMQAQKCSSSLIFLRRIFVIAIIVEKYTDLI